MDDEEKLLPFCAFCGLSFDLLDCFLMPDDPKMAKLKNLKLYADALGNHWCEEHWYRGKIINWGARHGWPLLNLHDGTLGCKDKDDVYIIPSGIDRWFGCLVVNRNEELGYLVEGIIDQLESEEQAS